MSASCDRVDVLKLLYFLFHSGFLSDKNKRKLCPAVQFRLNFDLALEQLRDLFADYKTHAWSRDIIIRQCVLLVCISDVDVRHEQVFLVCFRDADAIVLDIYYDSGLRRVHFVHLDF